MPQYHEIIVNGDGEIVSVRRDIPPPGMFPKLADLGALFPPFVCYAIIAGCVLSALIIGFCLLTGIGL